FGNQREGGVELRPAITFERRQHIARQAFAVEADQWQRPVRLPYYQRNMFPRHFRAAESD
ncbi:MAG: hypothetical protein RLZZ366_1237, partial [Pseudomonadota bacterium]